MKEILLPSVVLHFIVKIDFLTETVDLQSKLYVSCRILSVVILNFNLRIILFFCDNFRAFTLLHRLQITISNKLYRCMTLKYFFYHQIFFQDSAQTEKLTVFSNPKYTA